MEMRVQVCNNEGVPLHTPYIPDRMVTVHKLLAVMGHDIIDGDRRRPLAHGLTVW